MDTNQASEHLQVIRTLMERSALYRRALAPVMTFVGAIGLLAALAGRKLAIQTPVAFIGYWYCVAILALVVSFLLVRRQALKDAEPFWSSPTRRVANAMIPPLAAGFLAGAFAALMPLLKCGQGWLDSGHLLLALPALWTLFSGCALHAAGFYTQRGLRLFGWILILAGCLCVLIPVPEAPARTLDYSYLLMAGIFGLLHLLYGIYLYFTENRQNS